MAYGLITAHADLLLEVFRATSFTAMTLHAKLHTGDPGAAGTANASAVTTRRALTFAAASGGSMALASSPTAWTMTGTETLTAISLWDNVTHGAGSCIRTVQLAAPKSVVNLDTFTLSVCTLTYAPLAA